MESTTDELDELQSTASLSIPEDRQFVDDFLERVMELAQEAVGGQTKFTAIELVQLAGYRIQAKVKRASFNKVNPFNLFLKDNKTDDNVSLWKPVRGGEHINNGRPSFTGSYAKHMSVEYRDRKSEYEQKAKELNEAPKPKLTTESGLATWNRITKLATTFTSTMNDYDVHHILFMIPPNASPSMRGMCTSSNGYGKAFQLLMDQKETSVEQFEDLCRGGELRTQIEPTQQRVDRKQDALGKGVSDIIIERLSMCPVCKEASQF
jgi:hypothetical protein